MTSITTLCRTDRLKVTEYQCTHSPAERVLEEASRYDEFVLVLNGVFQKRASDGNVTLDPTRVGIFRKNQPYSVGHPVTGGDRSIILQYDSADLAAALRAEPNSSGTLMHCIPASISVTPSLIRLTGELCHAARQPARDTMFVEELGYAMLTELSSRIPVTGRSRRTIHEEKPCALDVAAFVSSRYRQKLSVGYIAEALQVSPFHLCRSFREATGTTIHRYLTILRMSEAALTIRDYRNSLTDLALELGYSSHSHFSATFRRFFGVTPVESISGTRVPERSPDRVH